MRRDVAVRSLVSQVGLLRCTGIMFILQGDAQQRDELVRECSRLAGPNVRQLIGEAHSRGEKKPARAARGEESTAGPWRRRKLRCEVFPTDRQNQTFGPLTTDDCVRMIDSWSCPASGLQREHMTRLLEHAAATHLQNDMHVRAGRTIEQSRIVHYTVRRRSNSGDPEPRHASELQRAVSGWILEVLPGKRGTLS